MWGLGISWALGPPAQRNTEPFQLNEEDRNHYMIAIALEYQHSGDLHRALDKLVTLRPLVDPLQALADAACDLASSDYSKSESGVKALRMAVRMYRAQGRSGCTEQLLPAEDPREQTGNSIGPGSAAAFPNGTPYQDTFKAGQQSDRHLARCRHVRTATDFLALNREHLLR